MEEEDALVCVLIDEVESLTAARKVRFASCALASLQQATPPVCLPVTRASPSGVAVDNLLISRNPRALCTEGGGVRLGARRRGARRERAAHAARRAQAATKRAGASHFTPYYFFVICPLGYGARQQCAARAARCAEVFAKHAGLSLFNT